MRFRRTDVILELDVARYQFGPDSDSANWLVVELSLEADGQAFRRADPCLETHDLEKLARWFEEAAKHADPLESWSLPHGCRLQTWCTFTEPCLEFSIRSGRPITCRVGLAAEFLPSHALHDQADGVRDHEGEAASVWFDFPTDRVALGSMASEVRRWIASFPVR